MLLSSGFDGVLWISPGCLPALTNARTFIIRNSASKGATRSHLKNVIGGNDAQDAADKCGPNYFSEDILFAGADSVFRLIRRVPCVAPAEDVSFIIDDVNMIPEFLLLDVSLRKMKEYYSPWVNFLIFFWSLFGKISFHYNKIEV